MSGLDRSDSYHLNAAQGWLGLGNWLEANEELERIAASMRAHPDVLHVRHEIYAAAKKWALAEEAARALSEIKPGDSFGYVAQAAALHKMKRTREAYGVLCCAARKFKANHEIHYRLACYACTLGKLEAAFTWLEKAIDLAGSQDIRARAVDDPALERLWANIFEIRLRSRS